MGAKVLVKRLAVPRVSAKKTRINHVDEVPAMQLFKSLVPVIFAASLLTGCEPSPERGNASSAEGQDGATPILQAAELLLAVGERPSAGYFTLVGSRGANQLIGVRSESAERIEMHQSQQVNGMMTMSAVSTLDIPAGAEIRFEPGGRHLMVWGISDEARQSQRLDVTLDFATGPDILMEMPIREAGAAAMGHNGH